ncbi:MAG: DUF6067 family protein [Kiritimatiellae bacterium]|nr:DUF6067 family protein [Kiritimatiellia bacterium]
MRQKRSVVLSVALMSAVPGWVAPCYGQYLRPEWNVVLNEKCFWRVRTIWETQEFVLPNREITHVEIDPAGKDFTWTNAVDGKTWNFSVKKAPVVRLPSRNDPNWMSPDYDDSAWVRLRGPFFANSANNNWKLVQLRGLFAVEDTKRAGSLTLSMSFLGGAVIYMNGKEVARFFMPDGPVDPTTPALPYPQEAYFNSTGEYVGRKTYQASEETLATQAKRIRKIEELKIPNRFLRNGVNVLAIGLHRAPADYSYGLYARDDGRGHERFWAKVGLRTLELIAQPGAAIVPNLGPEPDRVTAGAVRMNTGPLKDLGFHLRNQSIVQRVFIDDYPDPYSPLRPLQIVGVRNGLFAAQFLVGHGQEEITELKVHASDLTGPMTIPSSAVRIFYGVLDGHGTEHHNRWFDSLDDVPPETVPIYREQGAALQPVWVRVAIPRDAKCGQYAGTLTVTAKGQKPMNISLEIRVLDWTLPDPSDYAGYLDLMQSPDSVAMAYNVPMWSDKHFHLLDRTFELMSRMGAKTLYIPAIRRTQMGNEHAMIRWYRDDEGELRPDFTIAEKYLDAAIGRLGRIPAVILYCWEPPESQGHAGGTATAARTHDKPILITVVNPETGQVAERVGPAWGTPECREFWKKLTDGFREVLRKRGLESSLLFGLAGDHRPTKLAMDDICNAVPEAKWAIHSHYYCDKWQGYAMGLTVALWGVGYSPRDPSEGLSFGWSNPHQLCYFPREMSLSGSTPVEYRCKMETWIGALRGRGGVQKGSGVRGLGRLGADFWPVLRDGRGRIIGTLAGRYPEAAWGQLNLNNGVPHVLGMGRNGPVPTIRSEAFREAIQELEARVYLEKALLDDEAPQRLGEPLIRNCRETLDERIHVCLQAAGEGEAWFISSDWRERAERLFSLAAEVARRFPDRSPQPNLDPHL